MDRGACDRDYGQLQRASDTSYMEIGYLISYRSAIFWECSQLIDSRDLSNCGANTYLDEPRPRGSSPDLDRRQDDELQLS